MLTCRPRHIPTSSQHTVILSIRPGTQFELISNIFAAKSSLHAFPYQECSHILQAKGIISVVISVAYVYMVTSICIVVTQADVEAGIAGSDRPFLSQPRRLLRSLSKLAPMNFGKSSAYPLYESICADMIATLVKLLSTQS
jgi:hypothetical protein